jgi:hypothetical protein
MDHINSNFTAEESALVVSLVVNAWETHNLRVTTFVNSLSDEKLMTATAPGRNSGYYILGHLTAVNDALLPLLGFGEKLHPELAAIFLNNSEEYGRTDPSIASLKSYWQKINETLSAHIAQMKPHDWLAPHTAVSEADFLKEKHRNKLNVLIGRTNHQSYHWGQLIYLKDKA